MQKTFEDGISKGFVRGGQEIAGNLSYLSALTDENPLYQGEQGAQVLSQFNNGFSNATGLNNVNDVLTYRAAQETWDKITPEEQAKIYESAGMSKEDMARGTDWLNASLLLEHGFTPELFKAQMNMFETAEGKNNTEGIVRRMSEQYGMDTTQAYTLYSKYKDNPNVSNADFDLARKEGKITPAPPSANSNELDYTKQIEDFKTKLDEFGNKKFDIQLSKLPDLIAKQLKDLGIGTSTKPEPDTRAMTPDEKVDYYQKEYDDAVKTNDKAARETSLTYLETAKEEASNPSGMTGPELDNLWEQAGKVGKGFFSAGLPFDFLKSAQQKEDSDSQKGLTSMLGDAIYSGDKKEIKQAESVVNTFQSMPKDIQKQWDENNNVNNALANSKNIGDLITKLNEFIEFMREHGETRVDLIQEN
jgi:hypothetical protein